VLCTDGDKAYYGPFTNSKENREVRQKEVRELVEVLGTEDIVFLGFPDGRLRNTEKLREGIEAEIERFRPDYLMTFDDLYPRRFSHSDHRRTGEAAVQAAKSTGLPMWLLLFQSNAPTFRIDISGDWEEKRKLLAIHRSQFYGEGMQRIEGLVRGTAEREGAALGVALAEGFRAVRLD
jgi:LmbE family N-acetylglucosaminyl deacetylase